MYSSRPLLGLKHLSKLHVHKVSSKTLVAELLCLKQLTSRCKVALHHDCFEVIKRHVAIGVLHALPVASLDMHFHGTCHDVSRVLDAVSTLTGLTKPTVSDLHFSCRSDDGTAVKKLTTLLQQRTNLRSLRFFARNCPNYDDVSNHSFGIVKTN